MRSFALQVERLCMHHGICEIDCSSPHSQRRSPISLDYSLIFYLARSVFSDFHTGQGCSWLGRRQLCCCAQLPGNSLLTFHNSRAVCGDWLTGGGDVLRKPFLNLSLELGGWWPCNRSVSVDFALIHSFCIALFPAEFWRVDTSYIMHLSSWGQF